MGISKHLYNEDIQFFLNAIDKPTVILEKDHAIAMVNDCFLKRFSYDKESHIKDLIAPNEYEQFQVLLEKVLLIEKANEQFTVCGKDQEYMEKRIYLYYDPLKERTTVIIDEVDSNDSTTAVDWKNIFYHSDSFELIVDKVGRIFDINHYALKAFKEKRENLLNQSIEEAIQRHFRVDISFHQIQQHVDQKKYFEFIREFEYEEGKFGFYKVSIKKTPSEAFYMIRVIDWTDYMEMQQQVTQQDSLQEVGHLAASIAHEIRNPITTLKGFIQLMKTTADDTTTQYLAVINDEVDRMEGILSEMLALSKPTPLCKDIICIGELLSTIEKVIYPKATYENVELLLLNEFKGDPFVLGEEGKLKQVLLNLLKNSLESMENGGKLTVQLKNSERDCVTIVIRDTGKGIQEEHIQKVFMPYFTTRQSGTGLGLPFVLKTVEEHGGTISVSSELGQGACFIITFPLALEKDDARQEEACQVLIN